MINLTIDTGSWGWPQWTYIALSVLTLFTAVCKHGEQKSLTHYSIGETMLNAVIAYTLLSFGGFFA